MSQVSWFAVDDALDVIKGNFDIASAREKKGVEKVIFLESVRMAKVVSYEEDTLLKRHFRKILAHVDDDVVHLVSPVFANGHFFFAAICIMGREQLIVQSVGERGGTTPLQMYVTKLRQYLGIPENKVRLPGNRFGLRTDTHGANSCAGYALATTEAYLACGAKLGNATAITKQVHEGAEAWMKWLRNRDKKKKYVIKK